jgi:CheY-like chemotaxis protein
MPTSRQTASTPNGHIMIVEDSDEDFDTLMEVAREAGITHDIRRASSGGECLTSLQPVPLPTSGGGPALPTLILMDLNSHGIDGRDALAAIKSDAYLKHIPVVVLSTSANPKDVEFCYRSGANAYHVKPVRHTEYRSLLHDLLQYWLTFVTPPAAVRPHA